MEDQAICKDSIYDSSGNRKDEESFRQAEVGFDFLELCFLAFEDVATVWFRIHLYNVSEMTWKDFTRNGI